MSESSSPESATAALTASSACAASGLSADRVASEKPTPLSAILHRFSHMGALLLFRQLLGPGAGLELARVHGHRQHAVVPDRPGELDELLVAEALLERLRGCGIDAMLMDEVAREVHDLRVFGRNAA